MVFLHAVAVSEMLSEALVLLALLLAATATATARKHPHGEARAMALFRMMVDPEDGPARSAFELPDADAAAGTRNRMQAAKRGRGAFRAMYAREERLLRNRLTKL